MIIRPYEAQHLLIDVQASSKVALHPCTPRCNMEHTTIVRLDFFTFPITWPYKRYEKSQIHPNLFAGQIYLSSHEIYLGVGQLLRLVVGKAKEGWITGPGGFVL